MKKLLATLALAAWPLLAPSAQADLLLFDIDADPGAWAAAVAGLTASTAYDFNLDADYGAVTGFADPLTSAGGGGVSPGVLAAGVTMSAVDMGGSQPRLADVGPSEGFGNAENAVVANFFVDAFAVDFADAVVAFAFNAVSFTASEIADITVFDDGGGSTLFEDVFIGGPTGRNIGVLGTAGMLVGGVNIYDLGGGAEGVQGDGIVYSGERVPLPPTLALFGLALAGLGWSRRRAA